MEIKIKKGLDLRVPGEAERRTAWVPKVQTYAVKPTDYVGVVPKLLVAEGDMVELGGALFYDKRQPKVMFTSPVKGIVQAIVRGEKRKLLSVVIVAEEDGSEEEQQHRAPKDEQELKELMCRTGVWTALRQRPFGLVADPDEKPKSIFVSLYDSAPLAADNDYAIEGREEELVAGLKALTMLTDGLVHVGGRCGQRLLEIVDKAHIERVETHTLSGPHPIGNVGTQIAHIDPINKGDVVWTMAPQEVCILGHLANSGVYRPTKRVAIAGPGMRLPRYYELRTGACLESILRGQLDDNRMRIISGNVLTGTTLAMGATKSSDLSLCHLGATDTVVTALEEGDRYDFMGWLMPGLRKMSFSHTFVSGFGWLRRLTGRCEELTGWNPLPKPKHDTNLHGGVRPLVVTGQYEKVFPFDIYPMQLVKACIIQDIELMEALGIYEVEPEDLALCEYIDTSKTEIQTIIRQGLEVCRKG